WRHWGWILKLSRETRVARHSKICCTKMTIKVWTSGSEVGLLDKARARGSTFSYKRDVAPENAISLTMPVRLESWNMNYGLAPIFEMNLPEGALLERLR